MFLDIYHLYRLHRLHLYLKHMDRPKLPIHLHRQLHRHHNPIFLMHQKDQHLHRQELHHHQYPNYHHLDLIRMPDHPDLYPQSSLHLVGVDPEHHSHHLHLNLHYFYQFLFHLQFYLATHHHQSHIEKMDPTQRHHLHRVLRHYPYQSKKDWPKLEFP